MKYITELVMFQLEVYFILITESTQLFYTLLYLMEIIKSLQ